jgi:2-oxoisovalerate dehydrogenase E2 component (dihydrolipoyl transacylase)
MSTFKLPDLGEGLQDAEVVAWHVAEGDHVTADQPLVSVETDKAIVEVPSPQAGRIAHLLAKPGERVTVGGGLVDFEEGPHADTGTVMGVLPEAPAKAPAAVPAVAVAASAPPRSNGHAAARVQASPAVRAFAHARGVDLSGIAGTGPHGTITRADVERAVAAPAPPVSAAPSPAPSTQTAPVQLRGMQRAMAENIERAHQTVATATVFDEADVEAWWGIDHDVTGRLIRAVVAACAAVPVCNAWFDDKAMTLQSHTQVDLGMAVDTPDGLIVPVLRDAGRASAHDLRGEIDALKVAARARTLAPAVLRDPTITLSNFGMLAGRHAALALVPPQTAIVGAGRVTREAAPTDDGIRFVHRLPLSTTFDHRVVTGGDACRFLAAMIASLAQAKA